jgi:hypothetical protein
MRALRKCLWAIPVLAALPAPAAAASPNICGALNRLVAAARESPPFGSVRRALENGETVVPGFAASACRVAAETDFSCGGMEMGPGPFEDWPDQLACAGLVPDEPAARPPQAIRRGWARTYRAPGLRIDYGMRCLGCAGPSFSRFIVTFDRPGVRSE